MRRPRLPAKLGAGLASLRRRRGVPIVMSESMTECGAACLTMVLRHHGREVSLEECHERTRVGRDGANALDIAKAARSYGLQVVPVTVDLEGLRNVPCPAILHWSFNHFVVLDAYDKRGATLADPARGRVEVDHREMDRKFTGVALVLSPGDQFEPAGKPDDERSAWRILGERAFSAPGAWSLLRQIFVASLLLQGLGLVVPAATKLLVDSVLPMRIEEVMPLLGLAIVLIGITQLVMGYLRGLLFVSLQGRLDARLMTGFFDHVLALPYRYFQEHSSGDLIQRLSSNVTIRQVLSQQTVAGLLDGLMVVSYAVILIAIHPVFGLVAVGLGMVQVVLLLATTRRMNALTKQELAEAAESQGFMVEALGGIGSLKASGVEDRTLAHWTGLLTGQLEATMERSRLSAAISAAIIAIQRCSPLLLMWIGAQAVLSGSMQLGTMLALVALANNFLAPLTSLVASGQALQMVGGHLERIAQVLAAPPEQDLHAISPAPTLTGRVALEGVGFRYDPSSPWAVRGFSATIEPGQRVAFVGRSGSGKSTLAKLLLGLYEPEEGTIRYEGEDLSGLDWRGLRSQCGVVMQEPMVFNGSIRHNVAFNDPSLPLDAVVRAAHLADLDRDVRTMPMGYETIVAEGGSALSGGQRQRLALARALAHDPRILILDEATSALDLSTEATVAENLEQLGCTTVTIAHRLSTVRGADLIYVFDRGEVVETGTHEELLREDGLYAELVRDQMADDDDKLQEAAV